MTRRSYDPATEHEPLFTVDISSGGGPTLGEHAQAAERAVTSALCPECTRDRPVGLLRQGEHLVWRSHDHVTWGGIRTPCRASGAPVCETGLRAHTRDDKARCRHP